MSPAADSAGQPFEGRAFPDNPFAGDEGLADPVLASALEAFHEIVGRESGSGMAHDLADAWQRVIESIRTARLLSPLIAQAGEYGHTDEGLVVEKTQELSVVHLEGPDGRAVAPVFTDVVSMSAWRADARPIPVDARKAAVAAVSDGLSLMVINPGPSALTLRRGALQALASAEPYQPAWVDPLVADALAEGIATAGEWVEKHRVLPGDPGQVLAGPELVIALGVRPGLSPGDLDALIAEISLSWSTHDVLSRLVDGLGIKVVPV
jgi:hypothetical protein